MDEKSPPQGPFRVSPLYHKLRTAAKNVVVDAEGWIRVERFADPETEKQQANHSVALADISHICKMSVKGADVSSFIGQKLTKASIKEHLAFECELADNRYALCCPMTQDETLILSGPGPFEIPDSELNQRPESCFHFTDVTSFFAGLYICGPRSREVVSKLTELDVNPVHFDNLAVSYAEAYHVQCILLRLDLDGLLGYALFFDRGFGDYLWDRVVRAGREFDMGMMGLTSMKLLGWRLS